MTAPADGGWTTLGLDDEGLAALKRVVMTASLYADELMAGDERQQTAALAMHEDIELVCELLDTDLDSLWDEFEQERNRQYIEYAAASTRRLKR